MTRSLWSITTLRSLMSTSLSTLPAMAGIIRGDIIIMHGILPGTGTVGIGTGVPHGHGAGAIRAGARHGRGAGVIPAGDLHGDPDGAIPDGDRHGLTVPDRLQADVPSAYATATPE